MEDAVRYQTTEGAKFVSEETVKYLSLRKELQDDLNAAMGSLTNPYKDLYGGNFDKKMGDFLNNNILQLDTYTGDVTTNAVGSKTENPPPEDEKVLNAAEYWRTHLENNRVSVSASPLNTEKDYIVKFLLGEYRGGTASVVTSEDGSVQVDTLSADGTEGFRLIGDDAKQFIIDEGIDFAEHIKKYNILRFQEDPIKNVTNVRGLVELSEKQLLAMKGFKYNIGKKPSSSSDPKQGEWNKLNNSLGNIYDPASGNLRPDKVLWLLQSKLLKDRLYRGKITPDVVQQLIEKLSTSSSTTDIKPTIDNTTLDSNEISTEENVETLGTDLKGFTPLREGLGGKANVNVEEDVAPTFADAPELDSIMNTTEIYTPPSEVSEGSVVMDDATRKIVDAQAAKFKKYQHIINALVALRTNANGEPTSIGKQNMTDPSKRTGQFNNAIANVLRSMKIKPPSNNKERERLYRDIADYYIMVIGE